MPPEIPLPAADPRPHATGRINEQAVAALFVRARDGDGDALSALIRSVTPLLWQSARHQGLDRASCEDVVQTVWLRLFRAPDVIRTPAALIGWLITVTRREAWRVSSAHRREQPTEEAAVDQEMPRGTNPEQMVIADERDRLLWEAINQLTPTCRELLRLVAFVDRPSYDTVAQALGMPVGSIGPTRGRCLAKLRALLSADSRWSFS